MTRFNLISQVFGYGLFLIFLAAALVGLIWTPGSPYDMDLTNVSAPPGFDNGLAGVLGTDSYGRSLLSRLVVAVSNSLQVVLGGLTVGLILGASIGLWFGSKSKAAAVSNFFDFLTGVPTLVFALLMVSWVGGSKWGLIAVVALAMCTIFFRISYLGARRICKMPFVEVSFMMGKSRFFVVRKHIFPNLRRNLLAQVCPQLITCLMIESGLNYLGLGLPLKIPSLGGMIHEGQQLLFLSYGEGVVALVTLLLLSLGLGIAYLHLSRGEHYH